MMGAGVAAALARFDEAFCLFKGSNNVKRFLKDPSGIGAAQRGRLAGWADGTGWLAGGRVMTFQRMQLSKSAQHFLRSLAARAARRETHLQSTR